MRDGKRTGTLRLVALLVGATLLLPNQAGAGPEPTPTAARVRAQLKDAQNDQAKLRKALADSERALQGAQNELLSIQRQRLDARARRNQALADIARATRRIGQLQGQVASRARSTYMAGASVDLGVLMKSDNVDLLLDQMTILDHLARDDNASLEDLRVAQRAADHARAQLEQAQQELERSATVVRAKVAQASELYDLRHEAMVRLSRRIGDLRGQQASILLASNPPDGAPPGAPASVGECPRRGSQAAINLIWKESRWRPDADNPSSTAFGLGQLLIGNRIKYLGDDYATLDCGKQFYAFERYCLERYGSIEAAWSFWLSHHWY